MNRHILTRLDYHADLVLDALRERPHTSGELAALIQSSPNEVSRVIVKLKAQGHAIARGPAGSRFGVQYVLRTADYCPPVRCRREGCDTLLSCYNPSPYCHLHQQVSDVAEALIRALEKDVGGVQGEELFEEAGL